jgi:hypothetical protein
MQFPFLKSNPHLIFQYSHALCAGINNAHETASCKLLCYACNGKPLAVVFYVSILDCKGNNSGVYFK